MDDYQHRGQDEHSNGDDLFTEQEALDLAKAQGIEFVDEFSVNGDEDNVVFETRSAAKQRARELGIDVSNVVQTRRRKVE